MRHLPAAFFLTVFVLLIGCNAPHDNPLDPSSSHYRGTPSAPDLAGYVFSLHKANRGVSDTYSIIADLDGSFASELDTVWVRFDNRLSFGLAFDSLDFGWSTLLPASNFDDTRLANIIGQPFVFFGRNAQGTTYEVDPCYVWRVLYDVPLCIAPDSLAVVSPYPQLVWDPPTEIFPVMYYVQVINEATYDLMWQSPSIPAGVNSIAYPDSLADGRYQWTITMLDSFQNAAESVEAEFIVSHSLPL
jgi:hypothetical protein